MYIYFDKLKKVVTCDEFPEAVSVNVMEHFTCDKWQLTKKNEDGTFQVYYELNGTRMYLQNSGSIDILASKPCNMFCHLKEVPGQQCVFQWVGHENLIFALHVTADGHLSDSDMKGNLHLDCCHIVFTNEHP